MKIDLTPGVVDLVLYAGDVGAVIIEAVDDNDTPVDLSAWTGWIAQWRAKPKATDAIDLTVDATDAADGLLTVLFTAAATAAFRPTGVWDIEGLTPGGDPHTVVHGAVETDQDVSRRSAP